MIGARIAIVANTRTTEKPRTPSRLCRNVDQDVRSNRRTLCASVNPRVLHSTGPVSDTDTGIEDSVKHVRDNVSENHQHGDEEQDGTGEESVLEDNREQEVRSESVIGEDVL